MPELYCRTSDHLLSKNSDPWTCLNIALLGSVTIQSRSGADTKVEAQVKGKKVVALLAYLACNPGPHHRDRLADLLWDDLTPERYRPNLRATLNRLPKVFKAFLKTTTETVTFDPATKPTEKVEVDVLAFQQLESLLQRLKRQQPSDYITQLSRAEKRLTMLLGYYKGPFLDGLMLDDAPRFSDWQDMQREHLARLAMDGFDALIELYLHQGRYAMGIDYAKKMIELDPLNEKARRQLMVLLSYSGKREAALQTYSALVEMLDEEFGLPPMPETEAAYRRIVELASASHPQASSLPSLAQRVVGRETQIAQLIYLLQTPDCRLLTVTGLGGMGKTFLAVEAARWIEERSLFHGVIYVPLAELRSVERIPEALIRALGLVFAEQGEPAEQVCRYLADKELLILFDNFEHLLEPLDALPTVSRSPSKTNLAAIKIVTQILRRAPLLKILVTSRKPLQLQQEHIFALGGMVLPDEARLYAQDEIMDFEAVSLFQQVAARNNTAFEITQDNQQAVLQFCTLVQGTPLAIVLGAAHMDFLTPAELVAECLESLDILQGQWSDLPARQWNVQAIFDYSWQQLDEASRMAFQKLTLFQGFTLQAARNVTGASTRQLKEFYKRSLLVEVAQGRSDNRLESRYDIHSLLRLLVTEKMTDDPATSTWLTATQDQHMYFYLNRVGNKGQDHQSSQALDRMAELSADFNNILLAWQRAIETQNFVLLVTSCRGLANMYRIQGLYQQGLDLFTKSLQTLFPYCHSSVDLQSAPSIMFDSTETLATILDCYGRLLMTQGNFLILLGEPEQALEKVMIVLDDIVDETDENNGWYRPRAETQSFGYWVWARVLSIQGQDQDALEKVNEALLLTRYFEDQAAVADNLHLRGNIHFLLGQVDEAVADFQQAQQLYIQIGDRHSEIGCLDRLGTIVLEQTRGLASARTYFEQAHQISEEIDDILNKYKAYFNLCRVASLMGEYIRAEQGGREILNFYTEIGDRWMATEAHYFLGQIYNKLGLYTNAQEHHQQALELSRIMQAGRNELICLRELGFTATNLGQHQEALAFLEAAERLAAQFEVEFDSRSIYMADALYHLGRINESVVCYQEALHFFQSHDDLEFLAMDTAARLANVLLASGNPAVAVPYVEEVLPYLEKYREKPHRLLAPFDLYLYCYRVLVANDDDRGWPLLERAYDLLHHYANQIEDRAWRRIFLEDVPTHRGILQLIADS